MFGPGYQSVRFPISAGKTHGPTAILKRSIRPVRRRLSLAARYSVILDPTRKVRGGPVVRSTPLEQRTRWRSADPWGFFLQKKTHCITRNPQGPTFCWFSGPSGGGQGWGLSAVGPVPAKMRDEHLAPHGPPETPPWESRLRSKAQGLALCTFTSQNAPFPHLAALRSRQTAHLHIDPRLLREARVSALPVRLCLTAAPTTAAAG